MFSTSDSDRLQQLWNSFAGNLWRNPVQIGKIPQVVEAGKAPVETPLASKSETDYLADRLRVSHHVHPPDPGGSRVWYQERGEDLNRCCLPCSVRSEQTE